MLIPVRCFTCNKVIANKWLAYNNAVKNGEDPEEIFKRIGFKRYCCKRMFLGHIDLIDNLLLHSNNDDEITDLSTFTKNENDIEDLKYIQIK